MGWAATSPDRVGGDQVADNARGGRFAHDLFDGLAHRYDTLAEILSLGQNRRWRNAMLDPVVSARPASILDVATGPAGVALQAAARTDAKITGIDVTPEMTRRATQNILANGQGERIDLVVGRAEHLPFGDERFDALTFTYLLRYVEDPAAVLAEMCRVVKPGGVIAALEFHVPPQRMWRWLWWLYTRAVLPAFGYLLGGHEWFNVGRFLGPSISDHFRSYPLDWQIGAWREAGISVVETRIMSLGGGVVMWGSKQ